VRRAAAAGALLALAWAPSAAAADALAFDRAVAHAGDVVQVFTGTGAGQETVLPSPGDPGITVYLVRVDLVESLVGAGGVLAKREPETGDGVILLGPLSRDPAGVGRLSFVVPDVEPVRYTTGLWCVPCGGTFVTSFDPRSTAAEEGVVLRVSERPPREDEGGGMTFVGPAIGVLLALLVGAVVVRRRRRTAVGP
jgi:MYXO-CTERM domain-containing protein